MHAPTYRIHVSTPPCIGCAPIRMKSLLGCLIMAPIVIALAGMLCALGVGIMRLVVKLVKSFESHPSVQTGPRIPGPAH